MNSGSSPQADTTPTLPSSPMNTVLVTCPGKRRLRRWCVGATALLTLTVVLGWVRLAGPSRRAHEFAALLNAGKPDEAQAMLADGQPLFPFAGREVTLGTAEAHVFPQGVSESWLTCAWRGERPILVSYFGASESRHYWFHASRSSIRRLPATHDSVPLSIPAPYRDKEVGEVPEDIEGVPANEVHIGGDSKLRYFLIGLRVNAPPPEGGYRLLLVLPGGGGDAAFSPFVRRVYKNVLDERWLVAQLVAPSWDLRQKRTLVWPTAATPYEGAAFTTEEFADKVIADVESRAPVDEARRYLLAWSSGGPPSYSITLGPHSPIAGALIAMSIGPHDVPAEAELTGKSFFLLQSPDDRITKFGHAETARDTLSAAGAKVHLEPYAGGHGWRGDVWGFLRQGITWIDDDQSKGAKDGDR